MYEFIHSLFETIVLTRWLILMAMMVLGGFTVLLLKSLWQERQENKETHGLRWPLILFSLGLILRIGWIVATQPEPISDFFIYWQYASAFAQGDYTYAELSRHPGIIVLYSWFFNWFGTSLATGWALNVLFSGLMMILMYALGNLIFGRKAGLLALALTAFLPQLITYTALFASETPAITCFLMVFWAVLQSQKDVKSLQKPLGQKLIYWMALGVLLYGTILLRSSALIFLGLIPVLFVLFRRPQLKIAIQQFAVLAVTTVLLLSTWVAHQNIIGGSPKLFWGAELWLGCAIQYDRGGRYTDPKDMGFYPKIKPYYESGDLIKAYEIIGEESMKVVLADPLKYLTNGMTRMRYIAWTSQTGVRWSHRGSQQGSGLMDTWSQRYINKLANVSTIIWQVILCTSLLGLFAYRPRFYKKDLSKVQRHQEGWVFILGFLAIWGVFHYLFAVASERYSFQIIPFILLFFSGGLLRVFDGVKDFLSKRAMNMSSSSSN